MSTFKKSFPATIAVFGLLILSSPILAQTGILPSVRLDEPGVNQLAIADAEAAAMDFYNFDFVHANPPLVTNTNPTYAVAAQGATAGAGGVTCTGMALASGICITPVGGTTFIPKADSTLNLLATALGAEVGYGYGEACAFGTCRAQGNFRVVANRSAPNSTSGTLVSALYLVATGDDIDAASLGFTTLGATSAGSFVSAMGDATGFVVTGSIRTVTGPAVSGGVDGPPKDFMAFAPNLNEQWTGLQITNVGDRHRVSSDIDSSVHAYTDGVSMWGFSAAGSYSIIP